MMDILLTNDDGYNSVGFYPLLKKLTADFSVFPITPATQKSWVGKSITAHQELELKERSLGEFRVSTLDGTPADCVQVGLYHLLEQKPKLVVSGINIGNNLGHARILSSGTIGAAMEAAIDGVRAISTSLFIPPELVQKTDFFDPKNHHIFENAASITVKIIKAFLQTKVDPNIDLLSINIPFNATVDTEFKITRPVKEPYGQLFRKEGSGFIHNGSFLKLDNQPEGTDFRALYEGKISITPINLELVSKDSMELLNQQLQENW